MVMGTPLFRFSGVSAAYLDKVILEGLDFEIPEGQIIAVLGPNGSGKTTLLRLLAGILPPREGELFFQERSLRDFSRRDIARQISVLPQDTVVDFPFTAFEVVLMGRAPYLNTFQWEGAEDLAIARDAMRLTDSEAFASQDVRLLSGGERERVLLARALAQQPKALLLDEPTTHLDLKHWLGIYRLLRSLNRERGLTVVAVVHDLNFASLVADRVLLLAERRVQAFGSPEETLRPELIEKIFGTPVLTTRHEESGRPLFLPSLR